MKTGFMENAEESYIHEEEIGGIHVNMGNAKTDSNGIRGKQKPITMRNLHREVQNYRDDNERIMKD
jgi:hypothetical protein